MEYPDTRIVLTRQGHDEIRRELEEILTVKRPAIVNRIREARQLGDLSENFDYQDAKQTQGMLEARYRELQAIMSNALVVDCDAEAGTVGVGSRVVIKDLEDGSEEDYTIVGPAESSPSEGKISLESSVGSALMGHKVGEKVSCSTPGGIVEFEIVSVQ